MSELRAKWHGPPPAIGDYLMSSRRPRNAYRILHIQTTGHDAVDLFGDGPIGYKFEVVIIKACDVPEGATVHAWNWDRRDRRPVVWK